MLRLVLVTALLVSAVFAADDANTTPALDDQTSKEVAMATPVPVTSSSCRRYVTVMRESLVEIAARHFSEIDPGMDEEVYSSLFKSIDLTFRERRGPHASAAQFHKFALTLAYADSPLPTTRESAIRDEIVEHLEAGRLEEVRKLLGQLVLLISEVFVVGAADDIGVEQRCVTSGKRSHVFGTLAAELETIRKLTTTEIWEELMGIRPAVEAPHVEDKFFSIFATEAGMKTRLRKRDAPVEENEKSNKDYVVLTKIKFDRAESDLEIPFQVDCSISKIIIEATKMCGGLKVFVPNATVGKPVKWLDDKLELQMDTAHRNGEWTIKPVTSIKKGCEIKVSALSTMGFFLTTVTPKPTGTGYQVLHSNPTPYLSLGCLLDFYGLQRPKKSADYLPDRVRLVDSRGLDIIDPLDVTMQQDNSSASLFVPYGFQSLSSFRLVVEGSNSQGIKFVRMAPRLIEFSNILIEYDTTSADIRPGTKVKVPVKVTNYGKEDLISLETWDNKQIASIKPEARKILTNETKLFQMFLDVPEDAPPGSYSKTVILGRARRQATAPQTSSSVGVVVANELKISSMLITGVINNKFAETTIQTTVTNNDVKLREAKVDVLLPPDAFVCNFTMNINGKLIVGKVEEKNRADKIYNKAKQTGTTAGKVASRKQSTRDFSQSMMAAPGETIIFTTTYQQLLKRFNGSYTYPIILNPNQPVPHLMVDIHIVEETELAFVRTPGFNPLDEVFEGRDLPDEPPKGSTIDFSADRRACVVRYKPSVADQTAISPFGLNGAFTVHYDVAKQDMYGSMAVKNGYFTHFFAARSLPTRSKAVIFIMDRSGSMAGNKRDQAGETLNMLINLLDEQDYFNILFFAYDVKRFDLFDLVQATKENKEKAIEFVRRENNAWGKTNIKEAFDRAFGIFETYLEMSEDEKRGYSEKRLKGFEKRKEAFLEYFKMICFLTDGDHTTDWTTNDQLAERIRNRNQNRVQIHTVAFGNWADYEFLMQVSAENNGLTRRVFDNFDAAVSIRDFFYEVTNVVMTNVVVEYDPTQVESVTENQFSYISKGKEIVVSGRINQATIDEATMLQEQSDMDYKISGKVMGKGGSSDILIEFDIDPFQTSRTDSTQHKIADFAERTWAFMNIKKLISDAKATDNQTEIDQINAEALAISLKYNFVTPLTSIVVMKDEDRQRILKELAKEEKRRQQALMTTTTAAPITTTTVVPGASGAATTQSPPITNPSVNPTNNKYGGVYRDPHVVLPLKDGINLCFNWDGKDHEVHNLIFHAKTGLTINGMMAAAPAGIKSTTGKPRVYIHTIAFVVPQSKANIIVTPQNITFAYYGMKEFTIDVTSVFSISRFGLELYIYEVHGSMVKVQIKIDGVEYKLMLHLKSRVPHVDLAFDDLTHKATPGSLDGVIGQYYGRGVRLTKDDKGLSDMAILQVGDEVADVKQHMMKANPITRIQEPCWFSANGGVKLSKGTTSRFIVPTLVSKPNYPKKVKVPEADGKSDALQSQHAVLTALFKRR